MWRLMLLLSVLMAWGLGYYGGRVSAVPKLVTPDEVNTVEVANRAMGAVVTVIGKIAPEALQPGEDPYSYGSGFFYKSNLIATNYHVVSDPIVAVTVQLSDGRKVPATIFAVDPGLDLALLRVSGVQAPATLRLGDSRDLLPGQKLIVIGSPFGKRNTVSTAVFGSLNRIDELTDEVGSEIPEMMILTAADIQVGNSGGPVLDSKGLVVGLVDANLQNTVGAGGLLGLAIPSTLVAQSVNDLERFGVPQRGNLGAQLKDLADLEPYTRRLAGITSSEGAMVDDLEPGSDGAKAGLRSATRDRDGKLVNIGDIILKVNDVTVRDRFDVIREVARRQPGQTVVLRLWRNRAPATLRVPITARSR